MSAASKTVDEPAEEAAPPPGLALRAKRLLIAPLLLLGRLRQSKASETDEEAEAVPPAPRNARRSEADEAEAAPAAPPWWRRLLPYGLVLLAGTVAAWLIVTRLMTLSFVWDGMSAAAVVAGALAVTIGLGLVGTLIALSQKPAPVLRNL